MIQKYSKFLLITVFFFYSKNIFSQNIKLGIPANYANSKILKQSNALNQMGGAPSNITGQDTSKRVISTAVPFLMLAPDARAAGMGDVGVATSADANASHWNPAKLVFNEAQMGVSLSYSPWLRNLVNDMSLSYLTGYYKIDKIQAVGASLLYFDLGDIQFTDTQGGSLGTGTPREFALDATYSRKLSDYFSMAVTGRFVHSNVTGGVDLSNQTAQAKAGTTGAADISGYYLKPDVRIRSIKSDLAFGFNISNIGNKISYSSNDARDFIPINLRFGGSAGFKIDAYNKVTIAMDFNKLLVPTPPLLDSQGNIVKGKSARDKTVLQGMFGSFADAPNGFSEELQEFSIGTGIEYSYNNLFFVRTGYFTENANKGGRKYFTAGLGARYQMFGLDVAYLIPQRQNNPLAETLRFSLLLNFNGGLGKNKPTTVTPDEDLPPAEDNMNNE